ncbi:MAG: amino acid adenylation domain-containing protein, partial [Maribacter sp.]
MSNNHLPLTQSQLSLWTGQKLNPNVPLYNMAHSFDISGNIDVAIFLESFAMLVKKVDALRTVFVEKENIPFQSILETYDYTMDFLDFTSKTEDEIQNWIKKKTKANFDFSKPLFKSILIKAGEKRYIWFLNIHHLVTDATTSAILYELQNKIYKNIVEHTPQEIGEVPKFEEYIRFEIKQKYDELAEQILEHWEHKTKPPIQEPQLYGIKNNQKQTRSLRTRVKLGAERTTKLNQLAQLRTVRSWTQDLTVFNLLTTTLLTFMHRVSGQNNLVIGAPSHNRATKNFKKTPGLLIEVFPLFASFDESETYSSILEKIKLETNEYLRYAQPGMALPKVSKSFNVVLNYINSNFSSFYGMPMQSEWIHPDHCDPAHVLRCHVSDMDNTGEISVYLDLNTSVFNQSIIDEVPYHFIAVLDGLIADVNQSIFKPVLVNDAVATPSKSLDSYNSILSTFEEQVQKNPLVTAIQFKNKIYSFDELNKKANSLANHLRKKGSSVKPRVALHLERSPEYIIGILAILKLGGTFIPIASEQPVQRLAYIIEDAKALLILTSSTLIGKLSNSKISAINLNEFLKDTKNTDCEFTSIQTNKDDVAYILYTSGSTGKPKGVLISQGAISNYLIWASKTYSTNEKLKMPLFTSIGFDLTITSTFLPLLNGGKLIIYSEANQGPDISLMEVLAQNKVNTIKLTPSHLNLIKGADMRHSKIKTMVVGGEDFKRQLAEDITHSFNDDLRIYNEYGPTEATVGCIVSKYNQLQHKDSSVPIGIPIDHMSAYVLDTQLNRVPKGVPGELYLAGRGLAAGYQNLPEQTKDKFIENPFSKGRKMYRSGDLVRLNMQDEFEYSGRVDEQVKLNGFRLELSDIEANLAKHEAIKDVAVVLIEDQKAIPESEIKNCTVCGIPSNYPNTDFDANGICHICNAFQDYKEEANKYFKTEEELRQILISKRGKSPNYDCISLLSGGKDSTYILAQLINMGLRVLAFTLDNGYISDQAKENINRIVTKLEVDHVYGTTEHMNAIFVDSLHRHKNVCDGCFKTIYTLSTKIALDKQIPFIVTGLSRGQFFETRLTEELFWEENVDINSIDQTIL